MILDQIQIKNLRSCRDVTVLLNAYTSLVGANGAGKSTVLCALNVFFREVQQGGGDFSRLVEEDFHQKDIKDPINVTLTFSKLSPEAQADFSAYYRDGKLIITAEAAFDLGSRRAEVKHYGIRMVMPEFSEFFKAYGDNAKVPELKDMFGRIRESFPELPKETTKDAMAKALRDFEAAHPQRLSPHRSSDEFYGFSKGANRLAKYIQWVYVPAVKDASSEQSDARNTALGRLLARTVNAKMQFADQVETIRRRAHDDYQGLLRDSQNVLDGITSSLQNRLTEWAHPDARVRLEWWQDPENAVTIQEPTAQIIAGEDRFEGQLCRLGHGLQRSYLLALLQELASSGTGTGPRLLLGCEEPELYQHPPQARHLFDVFQSLSTVDAQVVVSTHSPVFVSGAAFEDVRLVRKDQTTKESLVTWTSFDAVATAVAAAAGETPVKPQGLRAKLHQTLQSNLNEMFFTQRLILVEGLEDIAYITAYLHLSGRWNEYRRLGCHMVAANGKDQIIQPLAVANAMGIRTFVVFDSDASKYGVIDPVADATGTQTQRRTLHLRDNTAILKLCGIPQAEPFPTESLFTERVVMWHSEIGGIVEEDIGEPDWSRFKNEALRELGQPGGLQKNTIQIALSLSKAWDAGKRPVHLERLCEYMLNTATLPAIAVTPGRALTA